jgi:hypothetical protein
MVVCEELGRFEGIALPRVSGYRIRTVSKTHSVEPPKVGLLIESRLPKLLKNQETRWNGEKPWKGF